MTLAQKVCRRSNGEKRMTETLKAEYLITTTCVICNSEKVLDEHASEYTRYFGFTDGIYICDECKRAIAWAKTQMQKT